MRIPITPAMSAALAAYGAARARLEQTERAERTANDAPRPRGQGGSRPLNRAVKTEAAALGEVRTEAEE